MAMIYRRKYARSYDTVYYDSTFKDSLQYSKWILDKNGNVLSSNEIALEDLDSEYDCNNGLIQFLGIEKREKSILELGGTEEQQEQLDLGKRVKQLAGDDLTEEEIIQALSYAKAQKKAKNIFMKKLKILPSVIMVQMKKITLTLIENHENEKTVIIQLI